MKKTSDIAMKSICSLKAGVTLMLAAALGMLISSCAKNEEAPLEEKAYARTVTVTITKDGTKAIDPDTKTAVVEGETEASYIWTNGDEAFMNIYENNVKGNITAASYSSDHKTATFTVTFNTSASATEFVYKAVYANTLSNDKNPLVPSAQAPETSSYDPAADVMISKEITSSSALTNLTFRMGRVVSVNKMTLTGLAAGEKVSKVEFELDAQISGYYNLNSGKYSNGLMKLTLNYNDVAVGSDGKFPVYFTCVPVDAASIVSVVVTTDQHVYTKSSSLNPNPFSGKTITFAIGVMKRFNMAMGDYGEDVSSAKIYTLVESTDDLVDGAEYIIAATSSGNYFAMGVNEGEKYNPSVEIPSSLVTNSGKTISIDNTVTAEPVILTMSGSNWLIQDNAEGSHYGHYLAATAAGKITERAASYGWSISIVEGTATITASNSSYGNLQYNAKDPRFNTYTSSQISPRLYMLNGKIVTVGISFEIPSYSFQIGSNGYNAFVGQSVTRDDDSDTRAVTYSIAGDNIGTVNSSSGEITLNGTTSGTATVTATVGASADYKAGSVSYTITVTPETGSNVTDEIIASDLTATTTNYTDFSGVTKPSGAVYAGNSAKNGDNIQLRSNSNSGIVATISGGRVAKVKVTWASNTTDGRTLDIYAKNTAYSSASDLYNSSTQGTKIGSIVCGTSTELTFDASTNYTYIGLRSNSGAMYLAKIEITWGESSGGEDPGGDDEEEGYTPTGWLELPAITTGSNIYNGTFYEGNNRNYTYHYDANYYTALWSAYPLTASHISGSADSKSWDYNPNISNKAVQINVISNSYGTNYGNSTYSRGHQVPAADRKNSATMRKQTFYVTNQTPQIQNSFNSPMWSSLEQAVRDLTSNTDTVYVVTGAAFQTVGGSETINTLTAAKTGIYPTTIYIPNYYWKVLLKVKRNSSGDITSASAIGFWADHVASPSTYTTYATSVSQIEAYTGFDFFTNLPQPLKSVAKANTNWSTFQSF